MTWGMKIGRVHLTTAKAVSERTPIIDRCWAHGATNHRLLIWGKGRPLETTGYAIRLRPVPTRALVIAWEQKGLTYRLAHRLTIALRTRRLQRERARRHADPSSGTAHTPMGQG